MLALKPAQGCTNQAETNIFGLALSGPAVQIIDFLVDTGQHVREDE